MLEQISFFSTVQLQEDATTHCMGRKVSLVCRFHDSLRSVLPSFHTPTSGVDHPLTRQKKSAMLVCTTVSPVVAVAGPAVEEADGSSGLRAVDRIGEVHVVVLEEEHLRWWARFASNILCMQKRPYKTQVEQ